MPQCGQCIRQIIYSPSAGAVPDGAEKNATGALHHLGYRIGSWVFSEHSHRSLTFSKKAGEMSSRFARRWPAHIAPLTCMECSRTVCLTSKIIRALPIGMGGHWSWTCNWKVFPNSLGHGRSSLCSKTEGKKRWRNERELQSRLQSG